MNSSLFNTFLPNGTQCRNISFSILANQSHSRLRQPTPVCKQRPHTNQYYQQWIRSVSSRSSLWRSTHVQKTFCGSLEAILILLPITMICKCEPVSLNVRFCGYTSLVCTNFKRFTKHNTKTAFCPEEDLTNIVLGRVWRMWNVHSPYTRRRSSPAIERTWKTRIYILERDSYFLILVLLTQLRFGTLRHNNPHHFHEGKRGRGEVAHVRKSKGGRMKLKSKNSRQEQLKHRMLIRPVSMTNYPTVCLVALFYWDSICLMPDTMIFYAQTGCGKPNIFMNESGHDSTPLEL